MKSIEEDSPLFQFFFPDHCQIGLQRPRDWCLSGTMGAQQDTPWNASNITALYGTEGFKEGPQLVLIYPKGRRDTNSSCTLTFSFPDIQTWQRI